MACAMLIRPGMSTWRSSTAAAAFILCVSTQAWAQAGFETTKSVPSLALESVKQTLLDPTTYAPAGMLYTSSRLDWNSSQVFFAHGDAENNPRYTVTGLPGSAPLSYSEGNKLLLTDALSVASVSFVNNTVAHFTVDAMAIRNPEHAKLWKALGWVERAAVASSLSYVLSVRHFEQWQTNEQIAAQRGW
jgi:hypothetical protein